MIKTGEKLVDDILEAVAKVPGKGVDKLHALQIAALIGSIYQNHMSDEIIEKGFGSTPGDALQNDIEGNLVEAARE